MGREHLDTVRGPIGWWALYVPLAVLVVIFIVAHYFPALRDMLYGNILPAAAALAHTVGIY